MPDDRNLGLPRLPSFLRQWSPATAPTPRPPAVLPPVPGRTLPVLDAAGHLRLVHGGRGRGTVALATIAGEAWHESHPRREDAASIAAMSEGMADLYMGTQPMRGRRAVSRLLALGCTYADLDTYRVPELAGLSPEELADLVLAHLAREGRPAPTLITDTGRGLAVWWSYDAVRPAALPRWQAVQRRAVASLACFGADAAAVDAARVLRVVGSVNGKNGRTVRALHVGPRTTFEDMASAFLPYSREQVRGFRKATARQRQARSEASAPRPRPALSRATWGAALMADLHRLRAYRYGACSVEVGMRDLFLFTAAIAAVWVGTPAEAAAEVRAFAQAVGWSERRAVQKAGTALRKAAAAGRGATVAYAGRDVDPRYTPKAATVAGWLQVTVHEARAAGLRLLAPEEVRQEQERERGRVRREAAGCAPRMAWLDDAAARALRAAALRVEGLAWQAVAAALGLPSPDAARRLAGRARPAEGPDRSVRVSSGVACFPLSLPALPPVVPSLSEGDEGSGEQGETSNPVDGPCAAGMDRRAIPVPPGPMPPAPRSLERPEPAPVPTVGFLRVTGDDAGVDPRFLPRKARSALARHERESWHQAAAKSGPAAYGQACAARRRGLHRDRREELGMLQETVDRLGAGLMGDPRADVPAAIAAGERLRLAVLGWSARLRAEERAEARQREVLGAGTGKPAPRLTRPQAAPERPGTVRGGQRGGVEAHGFH